MKITIKSNIDSVNRNLDSLNKAIERNVNLALKKSLTEVQKEAAANHRFITRSGNAERSIQTRFENMRAAVYLEPGIAYYSQFLHRKPVYGVVDPFLRNAFSKKLPETIKNLTDAIRKSISET